MSFLQRIEKAESFLQKLKALIDIAENHLYDQSLLLDLETIDTVTFGCISRKTTEESVAVMVSNAITRLHVSQPPVEIVEKMIDMFPTALSYSTNRNELNPLQYAANNLRLYAKYIHLLMRASCSGCLFDFRPGTSTNEIMLHFLVSTSFNFEISYITSDELDKSIADAIDHFCKQGFITKEDIENHNLLALSCNKRCMRRFECLARWHREALKTSRVEDKPLLHHLLSEENFDSVEVFLRVSFQLFPDESGLLFYGDYTEQDHVQMYQDALEHSYVSFYNSLEKVIRPISVPLLHQICKRSDGGHMLFVFEYRLSYLRELLDEDGRSYHQALFAYCPEHVIPSRHSLIRRPRIALIRPRIDRISLEGLETKDPITGLLPFVTVATKGSVECIYKVLLKHPAALLNCIETSAGQKGRPMILKRKRDNND